MNNGLMLVNPGMTGAGRSGQLGLTTSTYSLNPVPYVGNETANMGSSLKLDNIFNSAVGLMSQLISAKSSNPNTQIMNTGGQLVPIQQQTPTYGTAGQLTPQQQQAYLQQTGGIGQSAVNTGAGFLDGLAASFGISTGTFMLLSGVGLYLLFRPSPRGR